MNSRTASLGKSLGVYFEFRSVGLFGELDSTMKILFFFFYMTKLFNIKRIAQISER